MSGRNWFRRGGHWSRQPVRIEVSAEINSALIRELHRLTDYRIGNRSLLSLLDAVVIARLSHQEATRRAATQKDARCQLSAMLKLSDADIPQAIERCDTGTMALISKAQSNMHMAPETKWIASDDPDAMLGMQILAPESVRRSVQAALGCMGSGCRGRKERPHQLDLARACLAAWRECRPSRAPERLAFVRITFESAGMVLGDKRLGALLAQAARDPRKRSN